MDFTAPLPRRGVERVRRFLSSSAEVMLFAFPPLFRSLASAARPYSQLRETSQNRTSRWFGVVERQKSLREIEPEVRSRTDAGELEVGSNPLTSLQGLNPQPLSHSQTPLDILLDLMASLDKLRRGIR